jgi:hypothetical protein
MILVKGCTQTAAPTTPKKKQRLRQIASPLPPIPYWFPFLNFFDSIRFHPPDGPALPVAALLPDLPPIHRHVAIGLCGPAFDLSSSIIRPAIDHHALPDEKKSRNDSGLFRTSRS